VNACLRAASVLSVSLILSGGVCAQAPAGANEESPANGRELRGLVRTLASGAGKAHAAASARKSAADRALAARLEDFSRDARSLAARAERGATTRELDNEVTELERTSARVEAALASGRAPAGVVRPYREAVAALKRVRELVDGASPPPAPGAPVPRAATPDTDELLALVRDVDERMTLTQQAADRFAGANPGYAAELVGDVDSLASDARDLRRGAEGRADPRELRRLADRLYDGARSTGELMRASEAFRDSWGAWDQAVQDLARITELLPRL
jgi:hypothetical protein